VYDWPGLSGTGVRMIEYGEPGSKSFLMVESHSCSGASDIMLRRSGDKEGRRIRNESDTRSSSDPRFAEAMVSDGYV